MVLGFGGPEVIGKMRADFDDERARRDPDAVVSPGYVNDEFVALCPTFLMEDREEALASGLARCASSPRRSPTGPRPTESRPPRGTDKVDNIAFMKEHLEAAYKADRAG